MSLLILGGTGFLGRSLAEFFRKGNDRSVLTPTRKELNLSDRVACQEYIRLHKPDCIIHCAVTISSIDETLESFYNVASCYENFGKMIYFGSGAEYDPARYKPLMEENYSTDSFPIDGYPLVKWVIGNYIENNELKNITNLRLFAVYGKYEDFSRRFISNNICGALCGKPVSVNQDMKFDFIYVDDLCRYVKTIIKKESTVYPTYNICSGKPILLSQVAGIIKKLMNIDSPVRLIKPGYQAEYSGNPLRAEKEFGEITMRNHESAIQEMILFFENKFSTDQQFYKKIKGMFSEEA